MSFQSLFPEPMASFQVMSLVRASFQLFADADGETVLEGSSGRSGGSVGDELVVLGVEVAEIMLFGANHNLFICSGDNKVCQFASFMISPSTGMKSG